MNRRSITFTAPQLVYLAAEAERLGVSVSEIVRRIIDAQRETKNDRVWTSGELIDEPRYDILMTTVVDPFRPVVVTTRGMADAIREADEADYWHTRPIV